MQEKEQKISPIKQRILFFAEHLGISKRKFYDKIGVSRGTLESTSGITEDILSKFIATYPDISIEWLLKGEGEMLKTKRTPDVTPPKTERISNIKGTNNTSHHQDISAYISQLLDTIRSQAEEIGRLKARIDELERRGGENAGDVRSSGSANVG